MERQNLGILGAGIHLRILHRNSVQQAIFTCGRIFSGASETGWHDVPLEEQEKWNGLALQTSRAVLSGEATYDPWREMPCVYTICEEDRALLPSFQGRFASKMGGPGNTYWLPSSHSPFLSMPDRLVDVLQEIVKS